MSICSFRKTRCGDKYYFSLQRIFYYLTGGNGLLSDSESNDEGSETEDSDSSNRMDQDVETSEDDHTQREMYPNDPYTRPITARDLKGRTNSNAYGNSNNNAHVKSPSPKKNVSRPTTATGVPSTTTNTAFSNSNIDDFAAYYAKGIPGIPGNRPKTGESRPATATATNSSYAYSNDTTSGGGMYSSLNTPRFGSATNTPRTAADPSTMNNNANTNASSSAGFIPNQAAKPSKGSTYTSTHNGHEPAEQQSDSSMAHLAELYSRQGKDLYSAGQYAR